jgi:DNA-binding transcriptional LysR family regulator
MAAMRLEKLRQVDLNLLITFAAIAEERSVTAAASRLLLSQPAVSRALQRARAMFQDDLLLRSPHGFELTLRGRKILQELEGLLPRMENLVTPNLFDPPRRKATSAFPALTTSARLWSPACAGSMQMDATKCSLNSFPGRAASRS